MLLIDVSNIIHSGMDAQRAKPVGSEHQKSVYGIPYLFSKVADYARRSRDVIFVFDPEIRGEFHVKNPNNPNRKYSPQVHYECNILFKILEELKAPAVRVQGYSADSLIYSICELFKDDEAIADIFIMSADQDLACNVQYRGYGSVQTLAYNAKSYHITPDSYMPILGIPFNFTNINKSLLGCVSDNVSAVKDGRAMWVQFLSHLARVTKGKSMFRSNSARDLHKYVNIFEYNTKEYLINWVEKSEFSHRKAAVKASADIVFPTFTDNFEIGAQLDLGRWNGLADALFQHKKYLFCNELAIPMTQTELDRINKIIDETSPIVASFINSKDSGSWGVEGITDLQIDIMGDDDNE